MDFESNLKSYLTDLKATKKSLTLVKTSNGQVNSKVLRAKIESLSKSWFSTFKNKLGAAGLSEDNECISRRDNAFTHLLRLCSMHGNKKDAYLKDVNSVISKFQQELITPIQTGNPVSSTPMEEVFEGLLKGISNDEQNKYLSEAIDCAKAGYLKAAVVLGWCACIDQIQAKIDRLGYQSFNVTSARLASQKVGRFKHFGGTQNISDINELREIPDKNILTVIEGMGLVDYNQGTRLKSCLEMRNHSGHPGEAPITPYNVMSFFSDISEIVLLNPRFD